MTAGTKRRLLLGLGLFMVYQHSIYFGAFLVPEERYFLPLLNDMTLGERLLSLLMALPFNLGFLVIASGRTVKGSWRWPVLASLLAGIGLSFWLGSNRASVQGLYYRCISDFTASQPIWYNGIAAFFVLLIFSSFCHKSSTFFLLRLLPSNCLSSM